MSTTQRIVARVVALGSAYFAVSLLERMAATAEADAAAARLAAHTADEALWAHLTGDGCACPELETGRTGGGE
jgi:hypothetical protein